MTSTVSTPRSRSLSLAFYRNVLLKGLFLFLVFDLLFGFLNPLHSLGRLSIYNTLIPGRQRLPYADDPSKAYSLTLSNLEAMFASHCISGAPRTPNEFRIVLIGDSATWGYLLSIEHTLSANLNAAALLTPDGRHIQVYNLGYPVMSLTKDLLLLSYAVNYQPDMIIWLVTLESFPYDKQLFSPLLQQNPQPVRELIENSGLSLSFQDLIEIKQPSFWDRTLIGSRRTLADLFRLQLYGLMWAATGIDQDIPASTPAPSQDLTNELSFHNLQPSVLHESDLAFEILDAGIALAQPTPVLIVNEPVFISQGLNSDLRYNFYYPRWAYDGYRALMREKSAQYGWFYADFWDSIPSSEFSNTAIHLTPSGSRQFSALLAHTIQDFLARANLK